MSNMNNRLHERTGKHWKLFTLLWIVSATSLSSYAQQPPNDELLPQATLSNVIQYALKHQPSLQQSLINEQITETTIKSKLADWYPQLRFDYSLQHNFQVQTAIIGGNAIKLGVNNTSAGQFNVSQNIFNRDALLASRTASQVRQLAKQTTSSTKIDIAVEVSKAFYDVLATLQQIKVAEEDTIRLGRSLKDAFSQYQAGITDKTDYKRATIALNNARALLKSNSEVLKAKQEYLKSLMGYPEKAELTIVYDSLQMENEIPLDTLQAVSVNGRIEYQLLQTQKKLQEANVKYNKWAYLPDISAYGAYNLNFQNNTFSKLYNKNFPSSFAGLTLSVPIFQGGKRKYDIQQAELQVKSLDWEITRLVNSVNAEYVQALAVYKSNLANYLSLKENLVLAREVYDVIQLQYKSGIKTYLEVITSETDLRTAQINYYNALYQVLSGKIDVQKALGQVANVQ
jgi:outer membrane protein